MKYCFIRKVPLLHAQCRSNQLNKGIEQDASRLIQKKWKTKPCKQLLHTSGIGLGISHYYRNIPIAVALLPDQLCNLNAGLAHLLPGC